MKKSYQPQICNITEVKAKCYIIYIYTYTYILLLLLKWQIIKFVNANAWCQFNNHSFASERERPEIDETTAPATSLLALFTWAKAFSNDAQNKQAQSNFTASLN